MAKRKPGKKGAARTLKVVVTVLILAATGLVGWVYLAPMLTENSIPRYDSYTVETGDIQTTLSFSGTLDVKKSTTYTSSEMSRVKELYVVSGQEVNTGDSLVLLTNGELFVAGFDGVVNEIRYSIGDWVRPGANLVQICDLVNLQVTMDVDEYDVKSLEVGQACTISVISLGIDFETTIKHINRVSSASGTLAYYTVTCDLTVPPEVLPGMRATVTIPSQSALGVAVLPLNALGFLEDGSAYTLVLDANDAYEKRSLVTGLSDGMVVQIIGGVSVGDTVYAADGAQSVDTGFSFADIYRALFGEKVVINQASGQANSAMMLPENFGGELPEGFDGEIPESFGGQMPEGFDGDTSTDFSNRTPRNTNAGDTGDTSGSFDDIPLPDTNTDMTRTDTETDATQSEPEPQINNP